MDEGVGLVVRVAGELILLVLLLRILSNPSRFRSDTGWTPAKVAFVVVGMAAIAALLLAPIDEGAREGALLSIAVAGALALLWRQHKRPKASPPSEADRKAASRDMLVLWIAAMIATAVSLPVALTVGGKAATLIPLVLAAGAGVYAGLRLARRMSPPPSRAQLIGGLAVVVLIVFLLGAYVVYRL